MEWLNGQATGSMAGVIEHDFDPYELSTLLDPIAIHNGLRDVGPLFYIPRYDVYGTARYAECRQVLTDPTHFISSGGAGLPDIRKPDGRPPSPIVEVDPPQHTAIRRVLQDILSNKVIRHWRDQFEAGAAQIVDAVCQQAEVNGAAQIAEAYLYRVFPPALGIDTDTTNLKIIGSHALNLHGPKNELYRETEAQVASIAEWQREAQRRESLIPGGFGEELFKAERDGRIAEGLAERLMLTFLRGGMDTTIAGLSTTLLCLARNPDAWQSLRMDRSRCALAFEEALRLDQPVPVLYRTTIDAPVEFAGAIIPPNSKVALFLGAADRDERYWSNPDDYCLDRTERGHLAFGFGIHNCIGQMLARLEAECLLSELARRVERIELAGQPVYRPNNSLRSLDELPLRLTVD